MKPIRVLAVAAVFASLVQAGHAAPPPDKGPNAGSGDTQPAGAFIARLAPSKEEKVDGNIIETGRLDIDFRVNGPDGDSWSDDNRVGIVEVSSANSDNALVRNDEGGDCSAANPPEPAEPDPRDDGYGIDGAPGDGVCDDQVDGGETLVIDVLSAAGSKAAFDISGMYLTDFAPDKNGEAGQVTFTGLDGEQTTYTFTWKKQDQEPVDNNEVFIQFAASDRELVRFTQAEVTATVGGFSVAGFEQKPIALVDDSCPGQDENTAGCNALLAKGVELELVKEDSAIGNRGVTGVIYKNGVYRVPETRDYCLDGSEAPETLTIDFDGNGITDLELQPWQCGFADTDGGEAYFYILDLNGKNLSVAEDTITALFEDEGAANGYECLSPLSDRRPAIGWLPKAEDPIPVLEASEPPDDPAPRKSVKLQDVTTGPCGSARGSFTRFSYVVYHWVNAVNNPYAGNTSGDFPLIDLREVILERIDNLQYYVDQLFGCVQQGVNQSTFSSDTGRIRQAFETADTDSKYLRTVALINEMVGDVLDPRLNEEIRAGACYYDADLAYKAPTVPGEPDESDWVEANAVGSLLSQLAHLRWMIYTNYAEQGVGASFAKGNEPADYYSD